MRRLTVIALAVFPLLTAGIALAGMNEDEEPIEAEALEIVAESAAGPTIRTVAPVPVGRYGAVRRSSDDGKVTFFPNVKLPCSTQVAGPGGCGQIVEPEVVSARDGTIYVTAQEGVPAGVDFWRRDPGSFEYVQRPKPDALPAVTDATGLAYGGGDNDIAVSTDGKVYVSSLALTTAGVATSTDKGETWNYNVAASGLVGVDRQWITAVGEDTVFMSYHDFYAFNIWLVKSTDAGQTFGPPMSMLPPELIPQFAHPPFGGTAGMTGNVTSDLVADPDGRVALIFLGASDAAENVAGMAEPHNVYISITDENGENPEVHTVYEGDEDLVGLFPALASDLAGNLYAVWTDKHGIFVSVSRNHGAKWSKPVKVSTGRDNRSTVFPFAVAGSKGRVAAAWLGSSAKSSDDESAEWNTYMSITTDALAKKPRWIQVKASDHFVHAGSICLEGLGCDIFGGNRNLTEVLQMGVTTDGRVLIAYPDDSQTQFGWSFIAEQKTGPGLYANIEPRPPKPGKEPPGGPVTGSVRQTGTDRHYFLPGPDSGTPVQDPDGNVVDAPGDPGDLGSKAGPQGHVASANLWTTSTVGLPITFTGRPLKRSQIVGGTMALTTFLQEPSAEAANNNVNIRLVDVDPSGLEREIASAGEGYEAGIDVTEGNYLFEIAQPWALLKGHRLQVELFFFCFCSTTMRFYYGSEDTPSRVAVDRFVRA